MGNRDLRAEAREGDVVLAILLFGLLTQNGWEGGRAKSPAGADALVAVAGERPSGRCVGRSLGLLVQQWAWFPHSTSALPPILSSAVVACPLMPGADMASRQTCALTPETQRRAGSPASPRSTALEGSGWASFTIHLAGKVPKEHLECLGTKSPWGMPANIGL